jgi:hypothetical protein
MVHRRGSSLPSDTSLKNIDRKKNQQYQVAIDRAWTKLPMEPLFVSEDRAQRHHQGVSALATGYLFS